MRAFLLSTAAGALLAAAAPASATDITIGTSLAHACYISSFDSSPGPFAVRECDRALEDELLSDNDRLATIVNRGIVKMSLGNLRGADRDFDTAIRLKADEPEALLNMGLLRLRQNRLEEAIGYFGRSIDAKTLRPALAYYGRAMSQEQLGNVGRAYADLTRARDLDPKWPVPAEELTRYQVRR
jgi:tetratricopeptide (TPR) repeat protein